MRALGLDEVVKGDENSAPRLFMLEVAVKFILNLVVSLMVVGCAFPSDPLAYAKHFSSQGDYSGAFNIVKSTLAQPDNDPYRTQVINYVRSNKDIIAAGKKHCLMMITLSQLFI